MSLSNRQSQLIEALAQMLLRTFIQGEITFWVGKLQIMAGPPPSKIRHLHIILAVPIF